MAKTEYFEKQRDTLDSNDIPIKKWWKTLRNLSGLPCNSSNYPPLLLNDTYITKDIEQANAFNDYFCQQSLIDDSNSDIPASTPAIKGIQSLRLIYFYIESCQYSMFYTNCS
jgi:hypothetical protein